MGRRLQKTLQKCVICIWCNVISLFCRALADEIGRKGQGASLRCRARNWLRPPRLGGAKMPT